MTRIRNTLIAGLAALALAACAATGWAQEGAEHAPLDLNHATQAQIHALPVPPEVADAIWDHRTYVAYFSSLFDLLEIEGMTPELLERLRPLVEIIPPRFEAERMQREEESRRADELNYVVQRLLSEEGASEGLVDEYVDHIKDPRNVNRLDYFDLVSYQNVSPIDAVAILNEKSLSGRIENARQLRSSEGLSYYGYRNLRDFVRYDDPEIGRDRVNVDAQFRMYNTPYLLDDADILHENIIGDTQGLSEADAANFRNADLNTFAGRLNLDGAKPYVTNKLRLRYGRHLRGALLTHRNLGESDWAETAKGFVSIEDLPSKPTRFGPLTLHRLVLGNYTVAFGQGLIMDATDFFLPRRTGYGYSIRSLGASGDLSRSDEFALRGGALEGGWGRVRGTFFYSRDDKDAILNPDGSFNGYIRMTPRISNDLLADIRSDIETGMFAGRGEVSAFLPMRDVMEERVVGGHFDVELAPGTYVGLTGVEMKYENNQFHTPGADRWNPDPTTLVIDPARLEDRDAEIGARYDSRGLGNYRRIWGGDARAVWRNLAWAGEYAKLETSQKSGALERMFSAGPEAFVTHAYLQYENFNVLALYRDYDIGYDNPYDRAFSEDSRFEQTILDGNAFRLRNPYWATLGLQYPQAKAEQGWYFSTRYRITRQLTLQALEYDTWKRKADGADLKRVVARFEYQPIFPLRIRIRHANSSRHLDRPDDIREYNSWDSRIELIAYLSDYDQLRFLYSTSNVKFAVRGRLSGPAAGGDTQADTTGVRGIPGRALQAQVTHNFNTGLAATFSTEIYDGFLYNFEDNEFIVVDGKGFRSWFMLRSRLSDRLSWRLKWTSDHQLARTYVDIRDYGSLLAPTPDATNARADRSSFRLQLDYSL